MARDRGFQLAARARAKSLNQWPLLVVIAVFSGGMIYVNFGHWRRGTMLCGLAMGIGAVLRMVLPRRLAGLLEVRGKVFDVTAMLVLGLSIIVLAWFVPAPGR